MSKNKLATKARRVSVFSRRCNPELDTIDLHGKRLDEVEPVLDRDLNRLFMRGVADCRVLTGRGKVVAPAVARILASHPLVESVLDRNGWLRVTLAERKAGLLNES